MKEKKVYSIFNLTTAAAKLKAERAFETPIGNKETRRDKEQEQEQGRTPVKLKVKGFICSHRRSEHVARVQCEVNGGTNLICYEGFTTGAQASQLFVTLTFP